MKKALEDGLSQVKGVTVITVSGATGKGIDQLIGAAFEVREAWSKRVGTGELNRWFERAIEANPPPAPGGKRIKMRYVTQVKSRPPSFVIFGTRVDQLPASYERYLVNSMRRELGFGAVPVRLTLRRPRTRSTARTTDDYRQTSAGAARCCLPLIGYDPARFAGGAKTLSFEGSTLVDWPAFFATRAELGTGFVRILGYFREDG